MKNYELDNENNYCATEAEYNRMLRAIDDIKADSDLMSNIEQTISDFQSLISDLHKRPASHAKELEHDVDDYMERLISNIQYVEMLKSITENKEFFPFIFIKSYIDKRKKEFLDHLEILKREMINV